MTILILGRAIQGIGGGGLQQLTIIIITDIFSLRQRSLYLALVEVMWAVAGGIGPVLGGLLASSSWRWIFWLNLPITGVAFLLTIFFLDVHNPRTPLVIGLLAIDWLGIVSILGFTLLLLLGLNLGGVTYPWSSPTVICLLAFSPLFLALFILTEHKHAAHPIIPLHLLFGATASARSNAAAYTTVFAHGVVLLGLEYYIPLYLQSARALSPARSGLLTLPLVLTNALTAVACGVLIHRTGAYLSILRGGAAVLVGAGVGACLQPPELAVQARVPQDAVAAAMAALGFVRNVATALSVVGGGAAFANGMAAREGPLVRAGVDAGAARELAGAEAAAANVERVGELLRGEARLQGVVREAYAGALRNVWILYACVAGVTVVATLFVERSVLSDEHTETKTGIRSEERAGKGENG
ncbi:MFS transporter [Lasiodiplodia theobromae]|uniref:MFS transporter n=1 Tax=Lasiodiplodia theobromae TaxID=45133 RepID=UPI0015C36A22|nr:MFS transporter [Lasiodiplodia theobromae]KAF4538172.1 MFS transporter [Lasiodiplodia theobromae]